MATKKQQRVRVLRAFWHKSEIVGVDSVIDLPIGTAAELRSARKVEDVQADTKLSKTKKPTTRLEPYPDKSGKTAKE